jgi:MYXO-CTERM domain-containing protein
MRRAFISGLALLVPSVASAADVEVSPGDDIEAAIAGLQPGDALVMHGGTYTVTDRFSISIGGTEAMPIVIRAADGEVPVIERPDAGENIVDIDFADWVEIRGITFTGGSAGVRLTMVSNFTFEDNEIYGTNDVALRANDGGVTYSNLHIVHNHIHDTDNTGEGMYLGCNEDACRLADSVIERNWVHHTNQETVSQGDGIELKEGGSGVVIRDNVIHDTNYPCILTYSAVGNGPANVIEGNVMWNCGDHGMQVAADAVIRNNIVLSVVSDGIAMQPHQSGAPANLEVVHNTVLIPSGNAISVSGATGSILLANNAVYTMSGNAITVSGDTSMTTIAGNVGMGGLSGGGGGYVDGDPTVDFIDGSFAGAPPIDPFPATGGALVGAGDPAYATEIDFNGLPHADPPDVGAYAYDPEGNPGWEIQAGFKDAPADPPGGTGSGGEESGSSSDGDDETGGSGTSGVSATEGGPGSAEGGPGSAEGGPDTATATDGADTASNDDDEGGCGCRSDGAPPPVGLLWLGMIPLLRRRRARKR